MLGIVAASTFQERLNYIEHDQAAELYTTYINLQQYTIHPNPLHDLRLQ